jgi:hypothetical protein
MELYYYVYQFTKGKNCRFRFYYYKNNSTSCIFGDVGIELNGNIGRVAKFDPSTCLRLSDKEKTTIVESVLKYIYL